MRIDNALSAVRILDPERDVVGDLYETFAGASIRGQEGQFFTPKNAVKALVRATTGYGAGEHSVIFSNPPFDSKIVALSGSERERFVLAHKWKKNGNARYEQTRCLGINTAPQILFVERYLELLADGGRLGIVLPESTLSNAGHRYMVQYVLERATPLAVIGMPEALFKTSGKGGTHTKVCLVVFEKRSAAPDHRIFMADARWCGHDSRGLPIDRDDLPEIVRNYEAFRTGAPNVGTSTGFTVALTALRSRVLAPRYYNPEPQRQLRRLARSHKTYRVGDLIEAGVLLVATGHEVGKLAYGGGDVPFVRTSDISNWEIKVDPKHGISDELYDQLAPKQDVREGDILMVRDGTYLIGTCAMARRVLRRALAHAGVPSARRSTSRSASAYRLGPERAALGLEEQGHEPGKLFGGGFDNVPSSPLSIDVRTTTTKKRSGRVRRGRGGSVARIAGRRRSLDGYASDLVRLRRCGGAARGAGAWFSWRACFVYGDGHGQYVRPLTATDAHRVTLGYRRDDLVIRESFFVDGWSGCSTAHHPIPKRDGTFMTSHCRRHRDRFQPQKT